MDFNLFRLYTYPSPQHDLFNPQMPRDEILRITLDRVVRKKPVDKQWHIGKISALSDEVVYFKIGKIHIVKREQFINDDFEPVEWPEAMSTDCFMDIREGMVAIAKRSQLGKNPSQLAANRLVALLRRAFSDLEGAPDFEAEPISDPVKFLQQLEDASYIRKFFVSFLKPNPINVDPFLTVPMNELIRETKADKTHVEIMGPDLKKEVLVDIAHDAAARGADASASIVKNKKKEFIKLRESAAKTHLPVKDLNSADPSTLNAAWQSILKVYMRIKGPKAIKRGR